MFCATRSVDRIDFLKLDVEGAELRPARCRRLALAQEHDGDIFEFNDLDPAVGATGGALMPMARYLGEFGLRYVCVYTDTVTLPE